MVVIKNPAKFCKLFSLPPEPICQLPKKPTDRNGFSLIELLVVIAIIGILAAVGVVGYQGYIDATKDEAALSNGDTVKRAFDQDYIAIKNDLGGPTELATGVARTSQCLAYVKTTVSALNSKWKNAHNNADAYAVNLHKDPDNPTQAATKLKPGQIGLQCANAGETVESSDFYIHRCTCIGTSDCTLHTFTSSDTSDQNYIDYVAYVTDASARWRTDGTIKLGPHVPDWLCSKADFYN